MSVRALVLLAACALTAGEALWPGDVAAADQMWTAATAARGDDHRALVWVDVLAVNARVAPWQDGYARAAARVDAIAADRLAAVPEALR